MFFPWTQVQFSESMSGASQPLQLQAALVPGNLVLQFEHIHSVLNSSQIHPLFSSYLTLYLLTLFKINPLIKHLLLIDSWPCGLPLEGCRPTRNHTFKKISSSPNCYGLLIVTQLWWNLVPIFPLFAVVQLQLSPICAVLTAGSF